MNTGVLCLRSFCCLLISIVFCAGTLVYAREPDPDQEQRRQAWAKLTEEQKARRDHFEAGIGQERQRLKEAQQLYEQIMTQELMRCEEEQKQAAVQKKEVRLKRKADERQQRKAQLAEELKTKEAQKAQIVKISESTTQQLVAKQQESIRKQRDYRQKIKDAQVKQAAQINAALDKKETERTGLEKDIRDKKKELASTQEVQRQRRIQQQEQAAKDREQKRKERIEARKQAWKKLRLARSEKRAATRQEAAKQSQPAKEKEQIKPPVAMEQAVPAATSVKEQETAFLAEQKEKEHRLKEEEKNQARQAHEEAAQQRELQKQARLKEQQARKEEELRIVRESQQALPKQKTKPKRAKQAEQKAQPPSVQKPVPESAQQPQPSPEQVLQKRADDLKVYASQIKKELIDQESSQLRSPASYDPDDSEKIAQESVRPARRHAGSHPMATKEELARKQAMERSFRDESQRIPRRRPGRERAVNNALDKIDSWLEENFW